MERDRVRARVMTGLGQLLAEPDDLVVDLSVDLSGTAFRAT
jgi:hypothetical protein